MADGSQGFASAADSGSHAPGAGAVVCHLAAGPRLDVIDDGAGTATGPSHHRTPSTSSGGRRPSGREGPLPWSSSSPGVPPCPWRDAAGGVERGGAVTARHVGHGIGQLILEGSSAVCRRTVRIRLSRNSCLNYPRFHGGRLCRATARLQRGRGGPGLGERGGDRESVSGKQGPGPAESRQFPLRPGQPERRSQRALPDRPAIKSRNTPARLPAQFRAHPKCTSHFGFGLVPAV